MVQSVQSLFKRQIGDISSVTSLPTQDQTLFVCIGGLHGNELAGYEALDYICQHLDATQFRGRFVAIGGNLKALEAKKRYIDEDLNRIFLENYLQENDSAQATTKNLAELHELQEITNFVRSIPHEQYQRRVLIDLHTTSAPNGAFVVRTRTTDDRLAKCLEIPIILGLDDKLGGTAMTFMEKRGYETFAFEGGTIGEQNSKNNLIVGVWRILHALGMTSQAIPDLEHTLGYTLQKGVSQHLDCVYIHRIAENATFEMQKGFHNFDAVQKGQLLAHENGEPIYSPQDGYMLMPLYQPEGKDGFFIVESV